MSTLEQAVATALEAHPGVAVVYLFGSTARGEARADSDIDVGVVYERGAEERDRHAEVAADLSLAIARATGRERVDVVDLAAQGPVFCHRVLLEGRALHIGNEARRVDFESDVISRALDFRPTWEAATRGKVGAMRRWLRARREERHDLGADPVEAGHHPGEHREAR